MKPAHNSDDVIGNRENRKEVHRNIIRKIVNIHVNSPYHRQEIYPWFITIVEFVRNLMISKKFQQNLVKSHFLSLICIGPNLKLIDIMYFWEMRIQFPVFKSAPSVIAFLVLLYWSNFHVERLNVYYCFGTATQPFTHSWLAESYFLLGLVMLINNRWLYLWVYNFHDLHSKRLLD